MEPSPTSHLHKPLWRKCEPEYRAQLTTVRASSLPRLWRAAASRCPRASVVQAGRVMSAAMEVLAGALTALEDAGKPWPCRGSSLWISDDAEDREAAARLCETCPVLAQCRAAGDELAATSGVWGGTPRGNAGRRGRPRKTTTEQKAS